MSELWELVEGYSLEVGDVVKVGCEYPPQTIEIIDDNGWIPTPGFSIAPHDTVFRRVPDADDPRVLRRAILFMERSWLQGMGLRNTKYYIEKASKELESEGSDDQA